MQNRRITAMFIAAIVFAGCGREAREPTAESSDDTMPASSANEPAPLPQATSRSNQTISVEDLDRWQRGMEAELEAVQAAATRWAEAKDDDAKLEALSAATEMNTIDDGASAAGVDSDRYRRIRNTLSNAVSQLSPIEMEMDVSAMPAAIVEHMRQTRADSAAQLQKQLPEDVFAALQARAAELREREKLLVAERLKIAH